MNRLAIKWILMLVGVASLIVIGFLVARPEVLGFLKGINDAYAGTITAVFTVVLVGVTAIYVVLTYHQVNTTKRSVKVSENYLAHSERQLELSRIPVLVVDDIVARGSPYFGDESYQRRQLGVTCKIRNIGDSPAVTVYTRISFRFKHLEYEWKDQLFEYSYIGSLKTGEEKEVRMHFETRKIEKMLEDLSLAYTKNTYRVRNNPTQYKGTDVIVEAVYVNVHGKHFVSRLIHPILGVYPLSDEGDPEEGARFEFNGANLPDGKPFQVHLINPIFQDFAFSPIDTAEALTLIERYRELV